MVTLAREFDSCGECRLEIGGPKKYRTLSDDEIQQVVEALELNHSAIQEMYIAQCGCTDEWAEKYRAEVEHKADATLLARIGELEKALRVVNARLCEANRERLVGANDLGNRRAAFGASALTDGLCGNGSEVGAGETAMKGRK